MRRISALYPIVLLCLVLLPHCMPATATESVGPSPTTSSTTEPSSDPYLQARLRMVSTQIELRGVSSEAVLDALRTVPRHLFVPEEWLDQAYDDHPLPIGYNQTISQPYIVAWMTELLAVGEGDKVLEIGTGSGYQAAVLAELGVEVYTIEIVEALATQATDRLAQMNYEQITVRHGDGYYGWEEEAPFDAIIVTAAPDHVPSPLVQQLKEGGRMVIPVGPPGGYQSLFLIVKQEGQVQSQNLGGVRFVPLTSE